MIKHGGEYSSAALEGKIFGVANQAAVATTAALDTTYTGLAIGNPSGSTKKAVLLQAGFALAVAGPAAGVVGLMTGTGAIAASLSPRNALPGGPAASVTATAGQTIGTPVLERVLGSYGTVATTAYSIIPACLTELNGSLILLPGTFVAFYTTTACTAAFVFSFVWEEIPL